MDQLKNRNDAKDVVPARARLTALFDEGMFTEIDRHGRSDRESTGVIAGFGNVKGAPVYAFSQDSFASGGAVSKTASFKIRKIYDLAAKTGCPVVGIYDSKGGRIDEGIDMLTAYGEMLLWSGNISGVVPQIAVIAGICGGTSALAAVSADVVILAKEAELFLRKVGDDPKEALSGATENGAFHILAEDDLDAVRKARELITRLPGNNLSAVPVSENCPPEDMEKILSAADENTDMQAVLTALADSGSILELQPTFGKSATTAFARIEGMSAGFVVCKGGELDPDTCVKISRMVRLCDAFTVPMITLVNTTGFEASDKHPDILRESAKLAHIYAEATTPKVALITGKAYGAAYIALAGRCANADLVFAWPSAEISPLNPDAAVTILFHDRLDAGEKREDLLREYREETTSPYRLAAEGHIDDVIEPTESRAKLIGALEILARKRVSRLPKKHSNMPL